MNKISIFILIVLFLSCQKEPTNGTTEEPEIVIPPDAVEILDFETQITYFDSISVYAADHSKYSQFESLLNGEEVDLFSSITLREAGYYELEVDAASTNGNLDLFFQFVIVDSERGGAEWGIKKFTPSEIKEKAFALSELDFIYPSSYPKDLSLPVIFSANASKDKWEEYYAHLSVDGRATTIKRGIGSILLPPGRSANSFEVRMNNESSNLDIVDSDPEYINLEGSIEHSIILNEDGHYHITDDLIIEKSVVFQIPEGCIVKVDKGVNIYNHGQIRIQGTIVRPVIFVCSESDSYWGGFITIGAGAGIEVDGAIFIQSGFYDDPEYQYGHAKRQALFYHDNSELSIDNSYIMDNVGQVFYLHSQSTLYIENTLIQRAISAGEVVTSDIVIADCTFTDFPEYGRQFIDKDNDCIYLNKSNAVITNSAFMWSKDDGIDSGGSEGGNVQIDGCYFEGIFHEAVALSSGGTVTKNHEISNSTFRNNGQGIELGYSSPNHNVSVANCHFEENMIGVRYGDNYDWEVRGKMELIGCSFGINIDKDVWNFVRSEWGPIDENLIYE